MPSFVEQPNTQPHIGTGLSFPLRINLHSNLQLSSTIQNIEESVYMILGTRLGERVYRPNFGSRLSELVFAPMNLQTLLQIRIYIQEAIERWEPRIILDGIYTEPDPLNGQIKITITYHPKETHDYRSMVYPFYLLPNR